MRERAYSGLCDDDDDDRYLLQYSRTILNELYNVNDINV